MKDRDIWSLFFSVWFFCVLLIKFNKTHQYSDLDEALKVKKSLEPRMELNKHLSNKTLFMC
uniref:Uncharacterized protein n=1 Tax=Daphnia galeata TaxID=27404 RepID=A0A8J2RN61_9CRUS|nr:unnamed protein product [Daphnia galeata]